MLFSSADNSFGLNTSRTAIASLMDALKIEKATIAGCDWRADGQHHGGALAGTLQGHGVRERLSDRQPGSRQDAVAAKGRASVVVPVLFRHRTWPGRLREVSERFFQTRSGSSRRRSGRSTTPPSIAPRRPSTIPITSPSSSITTAGGWVSPKASQSYDDLEKRLAAFPVIAVPTITLEGDANGAPHPSPALTRRSSRASTRTGPSRAASATTCRRKRRARSPKPSSKSPVTDRCQLENVHNMATTVIACSLPLPRQERRGRIIAFKKCGLEPGSAQMPVSLRDACGSGRQRMQASISDPAVQSTLRARPAISRRELVEAIARVSRQDKAAFERVYAATSAKLYGIIIRILGRRDAADDVLQEVYIRVWQRAAEFDHYCLPDHLAGNDCAKSRAGRNQAEADAIARRLPRGVPSAQQR